MTLTPLPVPTKIYGGEAVATYSRRHAARNHTDPWCVEKALRDQGVLGSKSMKSPERLRVWRELGDLHPGTFTDARDDTRSPITERFLCQQCCQGHRVYGNAPRIGLVCLRHKRWIGGHRQLDVRCFPESLVAERHFRTHLAVRSVFFDALAMRVGEECCKAGFSPALLHERQQLTGITNIDVLVYPEKIAFARLFTRRPFLDIIANPDTEGETRSDLVRREVAAIVPSHPENQPWRAVSHGLLVAERLTQIVRHERLLSDTSSRQVHDILRFASLLT